MGLSAVCDCVNYWLISLSCFYSSHMQAMNAQTNLNELAVKSKHSMLALTMYGHRLSIYFILFILVSQITIIKQYNKILNTQLKYIYKILKLQRSMACQSLPRMIPKKRK